MREIFGYTLTWMPEGFFFLLFGAKIERRSRDRDEREKNAGHHRGFAAQFSLQTTGKKPSGTQGSLRWTGFPKVYYRFLKIFEDFPKTSERCRKLSEGVPANFDYSRTSFNALLEHFRGN